LAGPLDDSSESLTDGGAGGRARGAETRGADTALRTLAGLGWVLATCMWNTRNQEGLRVDPSVIRVYPNHRRRRRRTRPRRRHTRRGHGLAHPCGLGLGAGDLKKTYKEGVCLRNTL